MNDDVSLHACLCEAADAEYRIFQSRLIPNVRPERVLGVRVPVLRRLAKTIAGTDAAEAFMRTLPHAYYDEDNLHAALICQMQDYGETIDALDRFLPYVDNWATCDMLSPAVLRRHLAALRSEITRWLAATHPYTVRFGIGLLMRFYLDEAFSPDDLAAVAAVREEDDYYIRMGAAWYFATALARQEAATLVWLERGNLSPWVHAKTIRKACESDRIRPELKAYLRSLLRQPQRQDDSRLI